MPDQSSAATEHSIIQEITRPLESLPDDPLEIVNAEFPTALRGYDRVAVDDYVRQTRQLVAELQATRSPEAAVRRALERVGEQIGGILKRAHETAEQITAQSRSEAEDRLQQARSEARQLIDRAEQRVRDLDADTDRIWLERQRIVADAEDLAAQLQAVARTAAERFPEDEPEAVDAPLTRAESGPPEIIGPDAELVRPETVAADGPDAAETAGVIDASPEPAGADGREAELDDAVEPVVPFDGETTVETAEQPMYGVAPDEDAEFFGSEGSAEPPPRPPRSEVEQTMAFRPLTDERAQSPDDDPSPAESPQAGQDPDATPDQDPDATQIIPPSSQAANRRHDG